MQKSNIKINNAMRKTLAMIFAFVFSSSFVFGDTPPSGGEELNGDPVIVDIEPIDIRVASLEVEFSSSHLTLHGNVTVSWYGTTIRFEMPVNIQSITFTNDDTGETFTEWVNGTTAEINLLTSLNTPGVWHIQLVTSNMFLFTSFYIDESGHLSLYRKYKAGGFNGKGGSGSRYKKGF